MVGGFADVIGYGATFSHTYRYLLTGSLMIRQGWL
jgi:hypothetical protein